MCVDLRCVLGGGNLVGEKLGVSTRLLHGDVRTCRWRAAACAFDHVEDGASERRKEGRRRDVAGEHGKRARPHARRSSVLPDLLNLVV